MKKWTLIEGENKKKLRNGRNDDNSKRVQWTKKYENEGGRFPKPNYSCQMLKRKNEESSA